MLCGTDVASGLESIWSPGWRSAVVIGDSNTIRLFGPAIEKTLANLAPQVVVLQFPAGEKSKTRATKARLEDAMLAAGIGRDSCVVAVGGGVVLDVAGFVAATYMRGIAHVNVATSLLAQIDAAIGGKTGVNTPAGKNLVGAFHQPRAVLLDTGALATLPEKEMREGLAEGIKHAVVADAELFSALETWSAEEGTGKARRMTEDLLSRCVGIKAAIVENDIRDRGRRQILNFGHTVGHAVEVATRHRVTHGNAVAAGMVIEARLAIERTGFQVADLARLQALLTSLGLPIHPQCSFEKARPHLQLDKKSVGGEVQFALPRRLGTMHEGTGKWVQPVALEALERAWGRERHS